MNNITNIFVGGDISKNYIDIYLHPIGKAQKLENTKIGLKKLLKMLSDYQVQQIVFEATGGYEKLFAKRLKKAGYDVWVVDPKRVKAFIISEGVKAKTDKIDAKMIALFAASKKRDYKCVELSTEHDKLRAFVQRIHDLKEAISVEKKRLRHPQQEYCGNSIKESIKFMKKQMVAIQKQINCLISQNSAWQKKLEILLTVPGIGATTAIALIAEMPELGLIDSKKAAALLGVAPFTKQSGQYRGQERICGGRFMLRTIFYMAALTAMRYNKKMKEFNDRLRKAGKKPKVALVAIMRKLIVIVNIMIGKGEAWNPTA